MKYILGLAFSFNYFKNPAVLRIFVGQTLIDELTLKKNINRQHDLIKWTDESDGKSLHELPKNEVLLFGKNNWNYRKSFPMADKIFFYEIDEPVKDQKIRLEVINDNNNYSNGFMTKFSYFVFDMVFLMPKKYFMDLDLLADDHPDLTAYATPKFRSNKFIQDNPQEIADWKWPCNMQEYDVECKTWNTTSLGTATKKGGSFQYEFDLTSFKGMTVIKPKNFPRELMEKVNWIMEWTFLTYYVRGKLINKFKCI